jgi:hypothetical protein
MDIGTILSIIGILIAVVSLPWLKSTVERCARAIRRKWRLSSLPSDLQTCVDIRQGISSTVSDRWLICDWYHAIIFHRGDVAEHTFDITLVNATDHVQDEKTFPIYRAFCAQHGPADFQPHHCWAKVGRANYDWQPEGLAEGHNAAIVRLRFPAPIQPRGDVRLRWGYQNQSHYHEGRNWFEWYFAHPQGRYRLRLDFRKQWVAANVGATVSTPDMVPPPPRVTGSVITWTIKGPMPGAKYRLDFDLRRPLTAGRTPSSALV